MHIHMFDLTSECDFIEDAAREIAADMQDHPMLTLRQAVRFHVGHHKDEWQQAARRYPMALVHLHRCLVSLGAAH